MTNVAIGEVPEDIFEGLSEFGRRFNSIESLRDPCETRIGGQYCALDFALGRGECEEGWRDPVEVAVLHPLEGLVPVDCE